MGNRSARPLHIERKEMRAEIEQLEKDATDRLNDHVALTAQALSMNLEPLFVRLDGGVFFEHAQTGVTVAFSVAGFRVTWPMECGRAMGEAHFPVGNGTHVVQDLATALVAGLMVRHVQQESRAYCVDVGVRSDE